MSLTLAADAFLALLILGLAVWIIAASETYGAVVGFVAYGILGALVWVRLGAVAAGELLRRYDKVVIPEMNLGQLALLIRGKFLVDAIAYNQVRGLPFKAEELAGVIKDVVASV